MTCAWRKSSVVEGIPTSSSKLEEIKVATASDVNLQSVKRFIHTGWPELVSNVPTSISQYVQVKSELSEHNGLILRGNRIIVPQLMREDVLQKIHEGHQGLVKCRERVHSSVWWPRLATDRCPRSFVIKTQQGAVLRLNRLSQKSPVRTQGQTATPIYQRLFRPVRVRSHQ